MKSKVVVKMKDSYHARKLAEALKKWLSMSDAGGDAHLAFLSGRGEKPVDMGFVGHDVRVGDVSVEDDEEK